MADDRGLIDEISETHGIHENVSIQPETLIAHDGYESEGSSNAEIDEDDEENLFDIVHWFSKEGDVLPSIAKKYAKLLIGDGIGSIARLAKRVKKEGRKVLTNLAFKSPDVDEIIAALIKYDVDIMIVTTTQLLLN